MTVSSTWCGSDGVHHATGDLSPAADREAAAEAFSEFLTDSRFTAAEIRFVQLIVEHLTANGVMEARRLYEAPFTDHAPTGPDQLFAEADIDRMIVILDTVRAHAQAEETVA